MPEASRGAAERGTECVVHAIPWYVTCTARTSNVEHYHMNDGELMVYLRPDNAHWPNDKQLPIGRIRARRPRDPPPLQRKQVGSSVRPIAIIRTLSQSP